MNKGRRNELRQLKFKRRLKECGLTQKKKTDWICYKDQGQPCSCKMCAGEKFNRAKEKKDLINDY